MDKIHITPKPINILAIIVFIGVFMLLDTYLRNRSIYGVAVGLILIYLLLNSFNKSYIHIEQGIITVKPPTVFQKTWSLPLSNVISMKTERYRGPNLFSWKSIRVKSTTHSPYQILNSYYSKEDLTKLETFIKTNFPHINIELFS